MEAFSGSGRCAADRAKPPDQQHRRADPGTARCTPDHGRAGRSAAGGGGARATGA